MVEKTCVEVKIPIPNLFFSTHDGKGDRFPVSFPCGKNQLGKGDIKWEGMWQKCHLSACPASSQAYSHSKLVFSKLPPNTQTQKRSLEHYVACGRELSVVIGNQGGQTRLHHHKHLKTTAVAAWPTFRRGVG